MGSILGIEIFDEHSSSMLKGGTIGGVTGLSLGLLIGAYTGVGLFGYLALAGGFGSLGALGGSLIAGEMHVRYQLAGLTPPPIVIRRFAPEEDSDESIIEISDFKIIDTQVLQDLEEKDGYDFRDKPSYTIKIRLKNPNITLAELDYGNWKGNKDFDIEIHEKNSSVPLSGYDRDRVIESLQITPKFLGDQLYHPNIKVTNAIEESSQFAAGFLGSPIGGKIDSAYNWLREKITGKVRVVKIDREQGPSSRFETDEFYDDLVDVAITTGKYKELLFNHEKVIAKSKKDAFGIQIQKIIREKGCMSHSVTGVVAAISAIVALGFVAIGIACVFPPISSGIAAAVFLLASVVPTIIASVSGYFALKKVFLGWKIKKLRKKRATVDEEMKKEYAGMDALRDELQNTVDNELEELNLASRNQQNKSARVVARWLNYKGSDFCKKLNLSGNAITDDGVVRIARSLSISHSLCAIDLRRNDFTEFGVEVIADALNSNLSLTEVVYDEGKISKELSYQIKKQLLINRYLHQPLSSDDKTRVSKYFGSVEAIHEKTLEKINQTQILSCIQGLQLRKDSGFEDLNRAAVKRQLKLMFSNSGEGDVSLFSYIELYKNAKLDEIERYAKPEQIFNLIKYSIFVDYNDKLEFSFYANSGLESLIRLEPMHRVGLLAHCLDDKYPAFTSLVLSKLIGFDEVFSAQQKSLVHSQVRETMKKIFEKGYKKMSFSDLAKEVLKIKKADSKNEFPQVNDIAVGLLNSMADVDFQLKGNKEVQDAIKKLIKYDINTGSHILKALGTERRVKAIALALVHNAPIDVEIPGMSTLLSGLMRVSSGDDKGALDKDIKEIFEKYLLLDRNFEESIFWLSKLIEDHPELASEIKQVKQMALQVGLLNKYPFLAGKAKIIEAKRLEQLENDLYYKFSDLDNYDFITTDNERVKAVLNSIVHIKKLKEINDRKIFFQALLELPESNFDHILSKFSKINFKKMLEFIMDDLGSSKRLNCEYLRSLSDSKREQLLEYIFSEEENHSDAFRKAEIVSELINIDNIFDEDLQDDQMIKEINALIYSAIAPQSGFLRNLGIDIGGNQHYKLAQLKDKLEDWLNRIPEENKVFGLVKAAIEDPTYYDACEDTDDLTITSVAN